MNTYGLKNPQHQNYQDTNDKNQYDSILIHFSKPSHIKWTKINKDREEPNTVINDIDLIKLLNSKP